MQNHTFNFIFKTPILDDYNKRLDDLVHEIKKLHTINDKLSSELTTTKKEFLDQTTKYSTLKTQNHTLQQSNRTLLLETKSLKKNLISKEKFYSHRIRRLNFYEDRRTSRNKLEKILRLENKDLRNTNKILEEVVGIFGKVMGFDADLMCRVAEYMESVEDECMKVLVKNIVERWKKD